jgi:RNA polymerase sigma factor, sigma-70 family
MSSAVDPSLHAAASNLAVQTSAKPIAGAVEPEPGVPSDVDLMLGIQSGDAEALSELYDRYNGVVKALILRIIHDETGADDLLQEVFMEIWNQAKNFSAQKGKPLGWMVTLTRRRAIDALRKRQAYARAEGRLQAEPEQQPLAWVQNVTENAIRARDTRVLMAKVINSLPRGPAAGHRTCIFSGDEPARNRF